MRPATQASAAPITKVSEIVRLMFTPSSEAIFMSCSQARCWRPSDVRLISSVKPTMTSTVTTMIMICLSVICALMPSCVSSWNGAANWFVGGRREGLPGFALRKQDGFRKDDGHADGRDQRRQPRRPSQRPVGDALHCPAVERGERNGDQKHEDQRQRHPGDAE